MHCRRSEEIEKKEKKKKKDIVRIRLDWNEKVECDDEQRECLDLTKELTRMIFELTILTVDSDYDLDSIVRRS